MMTDQERQHASVITVRQVCRVLSLGLADDRLPHFQHSVDDWCKRHKINNADELSRRARSDSNLRQSLIDLIVVPETSFFRHPGHYSFVVEHIMPTLSRHERPYKVLSAGCATGEEAYSLAMLLEAVMPGQARQIVACDISEKNIHLAREGIYGNWSLRNMQSWPEMLAFLDKLPAGKYQVRDSIRQAVSFFTCNLTEQSPSAQLVNQQPFDLIFCRNLMIYMDETEADMLAQRLMSWLGPGGWLVPGPSDPVELYLKHLQAVATPDGLVFRHKSPDTGLSKCKPTKKNPEQEHTANTGVLIQKWGRWGGSRKPLLPPIREQRKGLARVGAESTPAPSESLASRVNELLNKGNAQAALKEIQKALQTKPLFPEGYLLRGLVYWQLEQTDMAITSLDKAMYLAPDNPLAYYFSGKLLVKQKRLDLARQQFLRSHKLLARMDPDRPLPLSQMATAGDLSKAVLSELALLDKTPLSTGH